MASRLPLAVPGRPGTSPRSSQSIDHPRGLGKDSQWRSGVFSSRSAGFVLDVVLVSVVSITLPLLAAKLDVTRAGLQSAG